MLDSHRDYSVTLKGRYSNYSVTFNGIPYVTYLRSLGHAQAKSTPRIKSSSIHRRVRSKLLDLEEPCLLREIKGQGSKRIKV